jgi:AcrR family transcriptional regulator
MGRMACGALWTQFTRVGAGASIRAEPDGDARQNPWPIALILSFQSAVCTEVALELEDLQRVVAELAPTREGADGTKHKVFRAAMELVALKGPQNAKIRDIAAASGCNIAAVNYYFGSKQALVEQVLVLIFAPINAERIALLKRFEAEDAPAPASVAHILEAMLRPLVYSVRSADGGSLYVRAEHHLRAQPDSASMVFVVSTFDSVAQYFLDALHRALPNFTRAELIWRYELVRGASIHLMLNCDPISGKFRHLARGTGMIDLDDKEVVLREMLEFSVAGFAAPPSWTAAQLRMTAD